MDSPGHRPSSIAATAAVGNCDDYQQKAADVDRRPDVLLRSLVHKLALQSLADDDGSAVNLSTYDHSTVGRKVSSASMQCAGVE